MLWCMLTAFATLKLQGLGCIELSDGYRMVSQSLSGGKAWHKGIAAAKLFHVWCSMTTKFIHCRQILRDKLAG